MRTDIYSIWGVTVYTYNGDHVHHHELGLGFLALIIVVAMALLMVRDFIREPEVWTLVKEWGRVVSGLMAIAVLFYMFFFA